MKPQRTFETVLLGIVGIVWGGILLCRAVSALIEFRSMPDSELVVRKILEWDFWMLLSGGVLFLGAGIAILRVPRTGHRLFAACASLLLVATAVGFLWFGCFLRTTRVAANIVIGGVSLGVLNRKRVKEALNLSEGDLQVERRNYRACLTIGAVALLGHFCAINFYFLPSDPTLFSPPQRLNYITSNESIGLNINREVRYFEHTFQVPSDLRLVKFSYDERFMKLSNQDNTLGIIFWGETVLNELLPLGRAFGIHDSHEFWKRFIDERVGLMILFSKKILSHPTPLGSFDEISSQDWKGFRWRRHTRWDTNVYEFLIWHKRVQAPLNLNSYWTQEDTGETVIRQILGSLAVNPSRITAHEHFQEGLRLLGLGDCEEAKFSLVSALYQDPQNAEYNFYVGRAFFETKAGQTAREFLTKSLSLQPTNGEAQRLLRELDKW